MLIPSLDFILFESTENDQILSKSAQVSYPLHELNKYLQCDYKRHCGTLIDTVEILFCTVKQSKLCYNSSYALNGEPSVQRNLTVYQSISQSEFQYELDSFQ